MKTKSIGPRGPQLLRTLIRNNWRLWIAPLAFYLGFAAFNLAGPVLVNIFVRRLQAGFVEPADVWLALACSLGVGFAAVAGGLCIQHFFNLNLRRIQMIINVVNTRIFRHALNLRKDAREKIPIGDIVNHLSTDTDSISEIMGAVGDLTYCLVMIGGAVGLLFYYIGSTAWVAVVLLGVLGPITRKVSREFTRFDKELMHQRDRRVSLMAQILGAIRLVKYFVWEKSVGEEVAAIRVHELAARRRIARAELMVTMLYVSVGTVVLFAVLSVHAWRGGVFDPALIFTCISLFSLLEDPFAFMSRVVSVMINAKVGADRVAKFLAEPVITQTSGADSAESGAVGVHVSNMTVTMGTFNALNGVEFSLAPGESLAVVGPVGSGKSTLIHALLGEVQPAHGRVEFVSLDGRAHADCRIGYVPQEAYILNGTLRENLTFGNNGISDDEIRAALDVAELSRDVQAMPGTLDIELGEKGVNLSGGQKQRLSLARAVLHQPQLVILDDPLSAVDPRTEEKLVRGLLFGRWARTTLIAITHRLNHLRDFDKIAFLDHGRLIGIGSFDELCEICPEFVSYLEHFDATHAAVEAEKSSAVHEAPSEAARITEDEDRAFGAVRGSVYWDYILSLGGENKRWRPLMLGFLFMAAASGTVLPLIQKTWLAYVSSHPVLPPFTVFSIYGGLGLLVMAGTLVADLFWLRRGLTAGRNIHDRMLESVLGSSVRFFDATPVGRILQRFSRDMEAIDIQLQWSFEHSMKCFAQVLVTLVLILAVLPWMIVGIGPVMLIYYRVQRLYRASAREAKRLDSISRSPRYAHFKETLHGLVTIRAYGKKEWFLEEFYRRLEHSQRMFFGHFMINRWFSSRIPVIGGLVSLFTTAGLVLAVKGGTLSPAAAGLLTVYSLSFWGVLNWGIRVWAEVEARMTSMERVKFYSRLPQESSVLRDGPAPEPWPSAGEVKFADVKLRYAEHLPLVLNGLSFTVPGGTKAGIVGRTGSGKSTLFQALFRFTEIESGRIFIDGVDIATVPLARLRKSLAIIPQDPTLFMGSLRANLDRYSEFTDCEIWDVLDRTSLAAFVRRLPLGLETPLTENGSNLSQGQRQLMCLARALLVRARVVILDEATASVDVRTDALVQKIIRESCHGITVLVIAHRLGTVRDCEQILEIEDGRLAQRSEKVTPLRRSSLMTLESSGRV